MREKIIQHKEKKNRVWISHLRYTNWQKSMATISLVKKNGNNINYTKISHFSDRDRATCSPHVKASWPQGAASASMDLQQLCWARLEFALAVVRDDRIGRRNALQLGQGGTNVIRIQAATALEGHGWDNEIGRRCTLVYLRACSREWGVLPIAMNRWDWEALGGLPGRRDWDALRFLLDGEPEREKGHESNGGKHRRRLRMDRMEEYSVC
jgi:hypothetical protein